VPEGYVMPDPEDVGGPETDDGEATEEEDEEDEDELFPQNKPQPKVQDFDFGDDFW
jgi:hypothetical protein